MDDLTGKNVIVVSDLHLGKKFKAKKFETLLRVIHQADFLIINGDLWEGHGMSFADFLHSPWQQLFSVFKQKHAVYVFGNHDPRTLVDADPSVFCDSAVEEYDFTQSNTTFHVRHGDKMSPTFDIKHPKTPRIILAAGAKLEKRIINIVGRRFLNIYKDDNARMLAWKISNLPKEDWLICGHSHLPDFDTENRFVNSGIFELPVASYVLILDGKPELIWA